MNQSLNNKVSLILGGTGIVGTGMVKEHLINGAKVIVPGRNLESLVELKNSISENLSSNLVIEQVDTTDFSKVKNFSEDIIKEFGLLDNVISSFGGWWYGKTIPEIEKEDWQKFFIDPIAAHFVFAANFASKVKEFGSYTFIQGNTVHHDEPKLSLISIQGSAVNSLWHSLSADMKGKIRVNGLALSRLKTKDNELNDPEILDANDVGVASIAIANSNVVGKQIEIGNRTEFDNLIRSLN